MDKKNAISRKSIFILLIIFGCYMVPLLFTVQIMKSTAQTALSATGSFFAGITGIVSGCFGSILIYLAYTKQIESNNILKEQNIDLKVQNQELSAQIKVDFILKLFEHINDELAAIEVKQPGDLMTGSRAIRHILSQITGSKKVSALSNMTKAVSIANSFKLLSNQIENANIPAEVKEVLKSKLINWYNSNLKIPFEFIKKPAKARPDIFDADSIIMVELMNKYEKEI